MQTKPLANHELVESSNLDDISEQLSGLYRHVNITPKRQKPLYDARVCYAQFPSSSLSVGFSTYGVSAEVHTTDELTDFFPIQYPLAGSADVVCGKDRFHATAGKIFIPKQSEPMLMQVSPDWAHYAFLLGRDAVERQLASMLGHPLNTPLEFETYLDLTSSKKANLNRLLQYTIQEISCANSILSFGATANQIEQLLITTLLYTQPHNYQEFLESPVKLVAPRHVIRAKEYMQEHLTESMDVNQLAEVTGISSRTLYKAFQKYCNTSPIAWLKHQKAQAIQKDLLAAQPGETVTDITMRWGVYNLGKFAAYYRDVFGELPSETMRRRKV